MGIVSKEPRTTDLKAADVRASQAVGVTHVVTLPHNVKDVSFIKSQVSSAEGLPGDGCAARHPEYDLRRSPAGFL